VAVINLRHHVIRYNCFFRNAGVFPMEDKLLYDMIIGWNILIIEFVIVLFVRLIEW
jgi:hypothetical protein